MKLHVPACAHVVSDYLCREPLWATARSRGGEEQRSTREISFLGTLPPFGT